MTTEKAKDLARDIQGTIQVVIEVTARSSGGCHAQISGNQDAWAPGETIDDAVGHLVRLHGDKMGIVVMFDPTQLR